MTAVLGRDVILRYLVEQGVPYVFGNPGTTEITFVDGCNDYPVEYVLALHEDVAVAAAMGYARASGRVGVVNLHVTPGVAHGMGNIYNAYRARIPLLVTAGQHHPALNLHEPILTSDLAGLVRPFTKWAYEVTLLDDLPVAMQRAFKELSTPPYGPVFLSIASNLFLEKVDDPPPPAVSRIATMGADDAAVALAAAALAEASNPLIVAGDGAGLAGAWDELVALAEAVGATVYTEGYATCWNFPPGHPHYAGPMPNLAGEMRRRFDGVDVVLLAGVASQAPVARHDEGGPLVPWRVRAVSVDDSPWEVGKNQPVEVGLVGDVKHNLRRLAAAVRVAPKDATAVASRTEAARARGVERVRTWERAAGAARESDTITGALVAAELREQMPADAVFVDESISNRAPFVNLLRFADPLAYFNVNGLTLGYSTGAAVGIQLALPRRRVVNVVGDGSLMYYPQALWNAANADVPVLVLVLNNAGYQVLKVVTERMGGPWGAHDAAPPGLDLATPTIDFVGLAQSMGVPGERADTPAELHIAIERGLGATGPYVVEVVLRQDRR